MTYDGRWEGALTIPSGVAIAASNSGGSGTAVSLTAGVYSGLTALVAHVVARLNAVRTPATWTGSVSIGPTGTGQVTFNWTGSGTYGIVFTDVNTRLALGFTADLVAITAGTPSVGAKQGKFLWLPDAPIRLSLDPRAAPTHTDRRTVITPTGAAFTHVGNKMYRQRAVFYSHVARAKVWEANAVLANASFETFWLDSQVAQGHAWGTPGAPVIIYDLNGVAVGINANAGAGLANGWYIAAPKELEDMLELADSSGWTGYYKVDIGDLVSNG